ncbi:MAG TPA: malto-oligosyltrehalose trehalohydrolase [Pirellulales bacterium]
MPSVQIARRLPVGAECQAGGVHFRLWAPKRRKVEVVGRESKAHCWTLTPEGDGYFSGLIPDLRAGFRYRFRLDDEDQLYPDPVSRFQPEGVHGPSEVVDPGGFTWTDADWDGPELLGQVVYEMHIGTFTPEGTYRAAAEHLAYLKDLGITTVEIMPVADFDGEFGWGYDGVDLYAPTRLYGRPDDLREFVNRAHSLGLAVILDVVYNHLGPSGCYLRIFADEYFTDRHKNEWGEGINYDDHGSGPVREFFVSNAGYWIDEFHFDGLRLDATHAIVDDSAEHVLLAISQEVRRAAGARRTWIVSENETQETGQITPIEDGGYGLDAAWNDDFHHAARVAMTGQNEYYYADYRGTPQELISALRWGYLFQGQWHVTQQKLRGTPAYHVPAARFVTFLENHDQTANSGQALRVHQLTSPGRYRAMTALLLLAPGTPMLFQGQEFASTRPFYYFADHEPELARLVCEGRVEFLKKFRSLADRQLCDFANPADRQTFLACKLDLADRERHSGALALHRDLLAMRREDPVFAAQRGDRVQGAVLAAECLVLRFFGAEHGDRLLFVNLGAGQRGYSAAEPLLAPPGGSKWELRWSSQDPRYGGPGTPPLDTREDWYLPAHAAVLLASKGTSP